MTVHPNNGWTQTGAPHWFPVREPFSFIESGRIDAPEAIPAGSTVKHDEHVIPNIIWRPG